MPDKLVTLITRTKDRALFIPRVFETVVEQSYRPIEWIIVNDNGESIVDLIETLKLKFEKQLDRIEIHLIDKKKSTTMEATSNTGLENAKGVYVKILDDDDSLDPECIEKQVSYMENEKLPNERGVVCYAQKIFEKIVEDKICVLNTTPWNLPPRYITIAKLAKTNQFAPITFLYERDVHNSIGSYNEELPVLGDWEFNLRFMMKFDIGVLPQVLANYHIRRDQSGAYGNTVKEVHQRYNAVIRNQFIRDEKIKSSISALISNVAMAESLDGKLKNILNNLNIIKNNQPISTQTDKSPVNTITAMLQPNVELADILKEIALLFENKKDINTALCIMEEAYVHRPNGPNIRKRIEVYKNILE